MLRLRARSRNDSAIDELRFSREALKRRLSELYRISRSPDGRWRDERSRRLTLKAARVAGEVSDFMELAERNTHRLTEADLVSALDTGRRMTEVLDRALARLDARDGDTAEGDSSS